MESSLVAGLIDYAESCLIFQVLNGLLLLIRSFDAVGELFEVLFHLFVLLLIQSQVLIAPHLRSLISVSLVLSTLRLVLQSQGLGELIIFLVASAHLHIWLSIIRG